MGLLQMLHHVSFAHPTFRSNSVATSFSTLEGGGVILLQVNLQELLGLKGILSFTIT